MTPDLILHVGQYKTGSTSIQRSLSFARDRLAGQGVLYPQTWLKNHGHGPLAAALKRAVRFGQAFDAGPLLAEAAASGCAYVILSAEGLSGAAMAEMEPDLVAAELRLLAAALPHWPMTVIWYYRRQDEAVESRMIQAIKGGRGGRNLDPAPFLRPQQALDYGFFHAVLRAALPGARLVARCLARPLLAGGEVVADFRAAAGLDGLLRDEDIRSSNRRPSGVQMSIQLGLNAMGPDRPRGEALWRAWARFEPAVEGAPAVLLTPQQRAAIMDYFAPANARFIDSVVPADQRPAVAAAFAAPVRDDRPNVAPDPAMLARFLNVSGLGPVLKRPAKDPPMQTIRVYLGAHKTASTHLQDLLVASRPALAEVGTAVADPALLRGDSGWITAYFAAAQQRTAGRAIKDATRQTLRALAPAKGDWVLTDENMLGTPRDVLWHHRFYADARRNLAVLPEVFPDRRLQAFLALRSYDGFFASMYSEIVRNRGFLPFAEFDAAVDPGWSWTQTVADLVAVFGEENVTLWDFADFRALQPQIVALLAGIEDAAPLIAAHPADSTRPSLSQRTIDILADLAPAIGTEAARDLTWKINQHYAVAKGHPPFRPFDDGRQAALRARYADDLAAIRRRWPRLRFLATAA